MAESTRSNRAGDPDATHPSLNFDAFISYRRSDGSKAARRLRQKLQRFDIRKRLKNLRRKKLNVFLDTIYERGADDFYERNIRPALLSSRRLIVLATPDAVLRSDMDDWIQREIDDFRTHRGPENILVVRAAGDFLAELPGDLSTTAPNIQIIDMRHDGFWSSLSPLRSSRMADEWIKLAAPLFDVPAKDMPRLRREQERAQQRALSIAAGALAGAAAFAVALSWYALTQQRAAKQTLDNSLFAVSRVIETASGLQLPDESADQKRAMLMTACDLFDNLADETARSTFELEVLNCDIDRVSALIASNETERARAFLGRIGPVVRARHAEKKTDAWAGAVSNLLDLEVMLGFQTTADNSPDEAAMFLANARAYGDLFKAHPTLFLASGYSTRVSALTAGMEEKGDFKGSAELSDTAARLFDGMTKPREFEDEESATQRRNFGMREAALLYRRVGWMRAEKLGDHDAALAATNAALDIAKRGAAAASKDSELYRAMRREEMLAEEIQGTVFINTEKYLEAMDADRRGLAIAEELLTLAPDGEFRQELEKEQGFLSQRVERVAAALQGRQP